MKLRYLNALTIYFIHSAILYKAIHLHSMWLTQAKRLYAHELASK